jgi:hypothetical protein
MKRRGLLQTSLDRRELGKRMFFSLQKNIFGSSDGIVGKILSNCSTTTGGV